MKVVFYGGMGLVFYDDHAKRYPKLADWQRAEFPDEVRFGVFLESGDFFPIEIIKRERDLADITPAEARELGSVDVLLAAKDVPISKCLYDGGS
jgi:hypothetical protein